MLKPVCLRHYIRSQFSLRYFSAVKPRTMKRINVRRIEDDERMQMSWVFSVNPENRGPGGLKQFNMDRLQNEELFKTLTRLQFNVSKLFNKKIKKKKSKEASQNNEHSEEVEITVPVALHNTQGKEIAGEIMNSEAWQDRSMLSIGEQKYEVVINPPKVISLALPKCIISDFPSKPTIDAEFIDLEHCKFIWYREESTSHHEEPSESGSEKAAKRAKEESRWIQIHDGHIYVPGTEDVGCRLKIKCQPCDSNREGDAVESISKSSVMKRPEECPFEKRQQQHTHEYVKDELVRVMSYNILADAYSDSDFSRNVLFPYCPEYALDMNYRKHLLMKEIAGYKADVVCLQEVDRKIFISDLLPRMESEGYEGLLKVKLGQVQEGTATFFRREKFRLLSQHDVGLNDILQNDAAFEDLLRKINDKEHLKEQMSERTTAVQVSVLEQIQDPNHRLLVATSHLYFHPKAPHIRIIQTLLCLHHIETIMKQFEAKGEVLPSVMFCGDFNSYPEGGVHQLLNNKHVPSHLADWYAGGRDEFLEGMDVSHQFDLTSACGYPRYTNYVTCFSGCLDYIYIEKSKLQTVNIIDMPTHEEVTKYTALPNVVFPSDHIAIICDLEWK